MELEYNTQRPLLPITEYGRNIKKMIDMAIAEEDREKRNKMAQGIVKSMSRLSPNGKEQSDYWQKIWDHLIIISEFKLDVDSPYTKPEINTTILKPDNISYPEKNIRYRYYGKIIQDIIKKVADIPDSEQKSTVIRYIANHLKKSYLNWNRDSVTDEIIINHLSDLSLNRLKLDEADKLEKTSELLALNKKAKLAERPEKFYKNKRNFRK